MSYRDLPHFNAALNALATVLLLGGYVCIRRKAVIAHATCMVCAFLTSILFLASYVTYHTVRHAREGAAHTTFPGKGAIATVYHAMLASHVVLAAVVPVLAIITLSRAMRGDFVRHKRIARWTLPIWLYVSITGVLVYLMLYHWYAPATARLPAAVAGRV